MTLEPHVDGGGGGDYSVEPIVAKYTALVSADLIWSDFVVDQGAEAARSMLQVAPAFVPSWPPRPLAGEMNGATPTTTLALVRLKAVLDFGAEFADDEVGDIRRHMADRWPELLSAETDATASKDGPFERISVTGIVRADGSAEWGFDRAPASGRPLPLDTEVAHGHRPELDLYVQNLVRADVEARLVAAP